jgi:hypothetical protein
MSADRFEQWKQGFSKWLDSLTPEQVEEMNKKEFDQASKDFKKMREALKAGNCSICGNPVSHFSEKKPCLHWLLKPNGFKKRHFPTLYERYSFHRMEAYLRWAANADTMVANINDLEEEKSPTKVIEETIRYKNLEWSFSCSQGDFKGHPDSKMGNMPHYHFQMKVDGNVIINYGAFHIPFHDEDRFGFAARNGEIPRMKHVHVQGAGLQGLFENLSPEQIIGTMRKAPGDPGGAFHIQTMVTADEGTTISGDDLAEIMKEHNETGVPIAKLIQRLKNVSISSVISPGDDSPDIAKRTPRR